MCTIFRLNVLKRKVCQIDSFWQTEFERFFIKIWAAVLISRNVFKSNVFWRLEASHRKIFRQINYLTIYLVKTLLSRNFCQKSVKVILRNFHIVLHTALKRILISLKNYFVKTFHSNKSVDFTKILIFQKRFDDAFMKFYYTVCKYPMKLSIWW